ncbi:MAG TPA: NAD-dependent epimerase/dehydratase family protein [Bacteroidota bacterium]
MKKSVLITGANGEIGHGLINHLADLDDIEIVALDLNPLDKHLAKKCTVAMVGDILKKDLLENLSTAYNFEIIYHLAALLSTRAEREPPLAHHVNVDGTLNLLEIAITQSRLQGREIKFLYPSSIAVYGLPDLGFKNTIKAVGESEWCQPRTMYGINKLYCEQLGNYYTRFYRQLDAQSSPGRIDFRCLRFPGLISAVTLPAGGTSDYASEMIHYAAQGKPYSCFVRDDTRIPFMAMPDAIQAILTLEAVPRERLSRQVYNVAAFNPSAGELYALVHEAFPKADVSFVSDLKRQTIVDSWPANVDTSASHNDWNWKPAFSLDRAFGEYLLPAVRERYHTS